MLQPSNVPSIKNDNLAQSVKELRNYIIDLNSYLKYKLSNLEVTNFTETDRIALTGASSAATASQADMATYQYVLSHIQSAVQTATELITGHQGGYVVLNPAEMPSEILIMDTNSILTAVNVWRWNGAGLGYSSTGYEGTYGLAITMDGSINANYITSGKITALEIVSATISGGTININNNFEVDASGNVTIKGGSININNKFIVDADGNVELAGSITWGAGSSPVKVQYSIDGSTLWHDTFASGDMFAKYSYDGGVTYTAAVRIVGEDGTNGTDGTDGADGTSVYTYVRYSEQADGTGFVTTPTALTIYIGIVTTTSATAPIDKTAYTWSKYQGSDASVPDYIHETYIDMTSVTSPYLIGTSIQGSEYIQYPMNKGWSFHIGPSYNTNYFISDVLLSPIDWFEINDVVNVGTTRGDNNIAASRTITDKETYAGTPPDTTEYVRYTLSGAPFAPSFCCQMTKITTQRFLTVYDDAFADPETKPADTHILGGIQYTNSDGDAFNDTVEFYSSNGSSLKMNSAKDIFAYALQSGGKIAILANDFINIVSYNNFVNIQNPAFIVFNGTSYETYRIVDGVAIGNTTTLIRTA